MKEKIRNNKGITLIALIITVVILLILAMVTISAIKGEDDLIAHAKNAAHQYQTEAENEKSALQGYLSKLDSVLGNNNGEDPNTEIPDKLKKYILGEELNGRVVTDIVNIEGEMSFIDETSTISNASTTATVITGANDGNLRILYFKYNGEFYKFGVNTENYMTDKTYGVVKLKQVEEGSKVGKYVRHDGEFWIILYDDKENGLQMISENVLKYNKKGFCLGYDDTSITDWSTLVSTADIDKNGTLENWEKALYSYNHAISTLNKACEDIVLLPSNKIKENGIRCVGSNPIDKTIENTTLYTSDKTVNWPNNEKKGVADKKGYSTDTNYLSDFERMIILGINIASYTGEFDENGHGDSYWLASRSSNVFFSEGSEAMRFGIRYGESDGGCYIRRFVVRKRFKYLYRRL